MSLNKALPDSNAPDKGAQRPESTSSDIAKNGYSIVAFPSQKPARSNADVGITADFALSEVNEGTSFPSYDEQPETISAETGS